jgi:hypothetical protein
LAAASFAEDDSFAAVPDGDAGGGEAVRRPPEEAEALGVALELEGSLASSPLGDGGGGAGPNEMVQATMSRSRLTCSTARSSSYSSAFLTFFFRKQFLKK